MDARSLRVARSFHGTARLANLPLGLSVQPAVKPPRTSSTRSPAPRLVCAALSCLGIRCRGTALESSADQRCWCRRAAALSVCDGPAAGTDATTHTAKLFFPAPVYTRKSRGKENKARGGSATPTAGQTLALRPVRIRDSKHDRRISLSSAGSDRRYADLIRRKV